MTRKKEIFILISWTIIFLSVIFWIEYMYGNSWKNQYMPARVRLMQGYLDDVQQGNFPQIEKSGNIDHALGFYILGAYVGNALNCNAEQTFRCFTLFFSISILLLLMFFVYFYYKKLLVSLITPVLGYICFEDFVFRVKYDVYVAIGIWMIVVATILFILLFSMEGYKQHVIIYIILAVVISFSNFAREHTSLGILVCFLISGMKDIYHYKLLKERMVLIIVMIFGILGYGFLSSGLPNILMRLDGQSYWMTVSTAWHNIYIGFGYFDNPYGIEYLDECAYEAVKRIDVNIPYYSDQYFNTCKMLVLELIKNDFAFCCISLIKKLIWIVGEIGIVTLRRAGRILMVLMEVIYLLKEKGTINSFLKKNIYIALYALIVGVIGLVPSVLTAPYMIYSITSYAMVQMVILLMFVKILNEIYMKFRYNI